MQAIVKLYVDFTTAGPLSMMGQLLAFAHDALSQKTYQLRESRPRNGK